MLFPKDLRGEAYLLTGLHPNGARPGCDWAALLFVELLSLDPGPAGPDGSPHEPDRRATHPDRRTRRRLGQQLPLIYGQP